MIEILKGNIFESGCEALVNPVNCKGVSGKGLALEFKNRYPESHEYYVYACSYSMLHPGDVLTDELEEPGKFILYAATKNHWSRPSELPWIRRIVKGIEESVSFNGISSIAVPALGCGLGGLDWNDVRPLLRQLNASDLHVKIYQPL